MMDIIIFQIGLNNRKNTLYSYIKTRSTSTVVTVAISNLEKATKN